MLIYIILMLALAYFFQKEGQKLLAGKSKLLAEFCQDAYATKTALSTLRILCLSSAVSGFWMLIAFLLSKTIHKFLTPFCPAFHPLLQHRIHPCHAAAQKAVNKNRKNLFLKSSLK